MKVDLSAKPEEQIPLIWTTKGNLPRASLVNNPRWVVSKGGKCVTFYDTWLLGAEVVHEAVHIYDTDVNVDTATILGQLNQPPEAGASAIESPMSVDYTPGA